MSVHIACYVRVSSDSQSPDSQVAAIRQWLRGNGYDADSVRWYIDHAASGKNLDRVAIKELQQDAFNGAVRQIVVFKLDRIARNLRDGINTLIGWLDQNVRVVSICEQFDFSGSVGQLVAAVLLSLAQIERESILERQRAGIELAKSKGKYCGRKRGSFKARPSRAAELKKQGLTVQEVAVTLGVSRMTAHRYLKRASH